MRTKINHSNLLSKGKNMLKYGYCGKCNKHTRHPKKKNCICDEPSEIYHYFQWIDYCKKNNLVEDLNIPGFKKKYLKR